MVCEVHGIDGLHGQRAAHIIKVKADGPSFLQSVNVDNNDRTQLYLGYSESYAIMVLHCPFLQLVAEAPQHQDPHAFARGKKSIDAAIHAINIAEALHIRSELPEGYCLTIDVLVMAAVILLVAQLGAPAYSAYSAVESSSQVAQTLLQSYAAESVAAAQCLESLKVRVFQNIQLPA